MTLEPKKSEEGEETAFCFMAGETEKDGNNGKQGYTPFALTRECSKQSEVRLGALTTTNTEKENLWLLDSGASDHMV